MVSAHLIKGNPFLKRLCLKTKCKRNVWVINKSNPNNCINKAGYLKSVNSPRDVESPDYLQVKECLKTEFYSEFEIIKIDDYGYVLEVDIGNDVISGEEFAKQEGLNSSCFYVEEVDDKVKIIVKGKGHGFGMSLFGAEMLAKQNYEYEKILNYYYSDIEIVKMIE